jgi:hypothetical protein
MIPRINVTNYAANDAPERRYLIKTSNDRAAGVAAGD